MGRREDRVRTQVVRWGKGLAVRIPAEVAAQAGLTAGAGVDVTVAGGSVVIRRVPAFALEELLAGITDENLHGEISTGAAVGAEEW